MEPWNPWITLLQTFGLAATILAFLAWAAVRAAQWTAPRVEKWVDRIMAGTEAIHDCDERVRAVEGRIETLWQFQLRRAAIEAVNQGVGHMNSPLRISDEAKQWLGELKTELQGFYRRLGRTLTDAQLAEEIERRWGDEIVRKVCIPHGLFQGACLLIAMEVAREAGPGAEGVAVA